MAKSATAKKSLPLKPKTTQKTASKAKPSLKIVQPSTKTSKNQPKKAASTAKSAVKQAKPAAKAAVKTTVKAAVKPAARKAVATKTSKAPIKQSAKPIAKPITLANSAKKPAAISTARPAAKPVAAAKPVEKVAEKNAQKTAASAAPAGKMVARPISVSSGFNRAARVNSIVKKRAKANASNKNSDFRVGCYVVYPTHGVGRIIDEETQTIGGMNLKMFVIEFVKDKMTLRVPVHRAQASGLRHVSTNNDIKKMYDTLKSKAKISRGMWSRRAQEYEAKINSGDVIMIAEVVRDLHQNVDQSERSYSERMIYESAFNRLAGELSASETLAYDEAGQKLLKLLRAKRAA